MFIAFSGWHKSTWVKDRNNSPGITNSRANRMKVKNRQQTLSDELICQLDRCLKISTSTGISSTKKNPASKMVEANLTKAENTHIVGLMRVNHAGEVAAQGLYVGQALTAKDPTLKEKMLKNSREEIDHLAWCNERLNELNGKPSFFTPVWYLGSYFLGALAGLAGDKFSLGFVEETEIQVAKHLESHLEKLPKKDEKTKAILQKMREDEKLHAMQAAEDGAEELPEIIKKAMSLTAKIMTFTAYRL
jgi:ubiquinone biosynthesis monooxygenase Coq7